MTRVSHSIILPQLYVCICIIRPVRASVTINWLNHCSIDTSYKEARLMVSLRHVLCGYINTCIVLG